MMLCCHTLLIFDVRFLLDCEQSLFFFRFSNARGEAARREKRGQQPEKKKEISFVVPLPSRVFSRVRGHLRVSGVLLDGPRKKERLFVV